MFFHRNIKPKASEQNSSFLQGMKESENKIIFTQQEDILFDALDKSTNSIQSYRYAVEIASQTDDLEKQIKAFQQVLEICFAERKSIKDDNQKRNMIMFWCYNNIGDAFAKKNFEDSGYPFEEANYNKAIQYYKKGIEFAKDDVEKISILRRISQVYKDRRDEDNWLKSQEDIINLLDDAKKREAYYDLAEQAMTLPKKKELLETALLYIMAEDVSVLIKCQNTLSIGCELKTLYKKSHDYSNYGKIEELMDKTAILASKAIEEKIENETERSKKLALYSRLLDIENGCLDTGEERRKKNLQKLYYILDEGEVLSVGDRKYSKKSLSNLINK